MTTHDAHHAPDQPAPFTDLDQYVALPRVGGLVLSQDGRRLVTSVSTLSTDSTAYTTALWEVDPSGQQPARRLTRSAKGEGGAIFTPSGDLLFTSGRPDPHSDVDATPAHPLLPATGGDDRVAASRAGGVGSPLTARDASTVVLTGGVLPSARDEEHDAELRAARSKKKVSAILHTGYPVRHWDHDLGPSDPHLFAADLAELDGAAAPADPRLSLRDLTHDVKTALRETSAVLSPDGTTVVTTINVPEPRGAERTVLAAVDVATGSRRILVDDGASEAHGPKVSPDNRTVAFVQQSRSSGHEAPRVTLALVDLAGGDVRPLATGWDRWPGSVTWLPDGSGLLVTADSDGRGPVFHVTLDGTVTQVTADDATFTDVQVSPDGQTVYALRVSYLEPSTPVSITATVTPAPRVVFHAACTP